MVESRQHKNLGRKVFPNTKNPLHKMPKRQTLSYINKSSAYIVAYDNLINIFVYRIIFNNALLLTVTSPVSFNIYFTIRRDSEMYSIVHCTIAS